MLPTSHSSQIYLHPWDQETKHQCSQHKWKHSQTANTRNKVQIIPTNSNSWYYSCVDSIIFITYDPCSLISLYWIPQYEIYEQVWEDMTIQDFENKTSNFRLKNKHDLRFDCFYSIQMNPCCWIQNNGNISFCRYLWKNISKFDPVISNNETEVVKGHTIGAANKAEWCNIINQTLKYNNNNQYEHFRVDMEGMIR